MIYVSKLEVIDKLTRALEANRKADPPTLPLTYQDGYEDAVMDALDLMEGWVGPHIQLQEIQIDGDAMKGVR